MDQETFRSIVKEIQHQHPYVDDIFLARMLRQSRQSFSQKKHGHVRFRPEEIAKLTAFFAQFKPVHIRVVTPDNLPRQFVVTQVVAESAPGAVAQQKGDAA